MTTDKETLVPFHVLSDQGRAKQLPVMRRSVACHGPLADHVDELCRLRGAGRVHAQLPRDRVQVTPLREVLQLLQQREDVVATALWKFREQLQHVDALDVKLCLRRRLERCDGRRYPCCDALA